MKQWTTHQIITLISALCYPAQQLCPVVKVALTQWVDALKTLADLLEERSEGNPERLWTPKEVRSLVLGRRSLCHGQQGAAMSAVLHVLEGGSRKAAQEPDPADKYDELDKTVWSWTE